MCDENLTLTWKSFTISLWSLDSLLYKVKNKYSGAGPTTAFHMLNMA